MKKVICFSLFILNQVLCWSKLWFSWTYFWIPRGVNSMWALTHWLKKDKRNHLQLISSRTLKACYYNNNTSNKYMITHTHPQIYIYISVALPDKQTEISRDPTYVEYCWNTTATTQASSAALNYTCPPPWSPHPLLCGVLPTKDMEVLPAPMVNATLSLWGHVQLHESQCFLPSCSTVSSSLLWSQAEDLCLKVPYRTSCPLRTRSPPLARLKQDQNCRQD